MMLSWLVMQPAPAVPAPALVPAPAAAPTVARAHVRCGVVSWRGGVCARFELSCACCDKQLMWLFVMHSAPAVSVVGVRVRSVGDPLCGS